MKNPVDDMIRSFSRDELRQFKYFIRKNGNSDKEKDIEVIEQIRLESAYHDGLKTNVHLQIRKRLKQALTQFAMLENLRYDKGSEIASLIELAKYLFRKDLHEHAWNALYRAEKLAIEGEEYEFLDFIYRIQISYSSIVYMPGISNHHTPELISRRDRNASMARLNADANAAYAQLLHHLRENARNPNFDIDGLVNEVLMHYSLDDKIRTDAKIYMRITQLVAKALHEKKEFDKLKAYAINAYTVMVRKRMLGKVEADSLMEILFFIYTAAIKTKDYRNCEKYIGLYHQHAEGIKAQDRYQSYSITYNVNLADLYLLTDRLVDARKIMLDMFNKYSAQKSAAKLYYLLRLNLIAIHFKSGEIKQCLRLYNEVMQQPIDRMLKIGGIEIVLFTEIYGALIYFENDDSDYAMDLLKRIKAKYSQEFAKGLLKRERIFIKIMEKIINKPAYIHDKMFRTHIGRFAKLKEYIPGDKEYISLTAWLESKLSKRTYYSCFLGRVGN
jgi:hypothetical protein